MFPRSLLLGPSGYPYVPITVNVLGAPTAISGVKSRAIIDTPTAIATGHETAILTSNDAPGGDLQLRYRNLGVAGNPGYNSGNS